MKMVEESDRIWTNIDLHGKALADHCIRITKLEQTHLYSDKLKKNLVYYLLGGIASIQLIFLSIDRLLP